MLTVCRQKLNILLHNILRWGNSLSLLLVNKPKLIKSSVNFKIFLKRIFMFYNIYVALINIVTAVCILASYIFKIYIFMI